MKKIVFSFFMASFTLTTVMSQTYTMSNTTISTCFGQFCDSGGPEGAYNENEDQVCTINSAEEGANLVLRFVEFKLNGNDWLSVYDGNSTTAKLIGTYSKNNLIPFTIQSTGSSLTFVFHSDAQSNGKGWQASIACYKNGAKILRSNLATPSVTLIYSLKGVKSETDAALMKKVLEENKFILSSSISLKNENIWVIAPDESYVDEIKQILINTKEFLGYEIGVDYLSHFHSKNQ